MAKKYYWLKLKEDFFSQPRIKKLRKIAGGETYTLIYLKLQLLSLKNDGVLTFEGIEDDFANELSLIIDETPENIQFTLMYLLQQGLIEEVRENQYALLETMENIGNETAGAQRVRKLRESRKALQCNTDVTNCNTLVTNCNTDVQKCNTEIEIEIEIEKEIEKEKEKDYCTEPGKPDSMPEPQKAKDDSPIIITMPLNTGKPYKIQQSSVDRWQELYPAVDIMQELRNMCGWLESNRSRRKTKDGMPRFINNWLSKEQNRGGRNPKNQSLPAHEKFETTKRNLNQYVE